VVHPPAEPVLIMGMGCPLLWVQVMTSVLVVVQSPDRFPFVIDVAPENSVSSPVTGDPVTVVVPELVPQGPLEVTICTTPPTVRAWIQLPETSAEPISATLVGISAVDKGRNVGMAVGSVNPDISNPIKDPLMPAPVIVVNVRLS